MDSTLAPYSLRHERTLDHDVSQTGRTGTYALDTGAGRSAALCSPIVHTALCEPLSIARHLTRDLMLDPSDRLTAN